MLRAVALLAAFAATGVAEPLPAVPVLPAPRVEPAPSVVFEGYVGVATNLDGTGGAAGARFLRRAWSFDAALEVTGFETHAMLDVTRAGATISGCRHVSLLAVCPIVAAGFVHGSGDRVSRSIAPLVAVGARAALELQATRRIAVRMRFDGRVRVTATELEVDDMTAWAAPRGELWLGVDVLARLF